LGTRRGGGAIVWGAEVMGDQPIPERGSGHRWPARLEVWSFPLAVVAAALVGVGPVAHRFGILPLTPALLAVPLGVCLSLCALVAAGVALVRGALPSPVRRRVVVAATLSAVTGVGPLAIVAPKLSLPAIHDVTTDTDDPPTFAAVVPLRVGAANALDYGGPDVAEAQRAAYPELQTLRLGEPPEVVLRQVRRVAEEIGWDVVEVDDATGRLEATATSFWFGFTDDIVVRVQSSEVVGGAQIDVRSVSRVGVGDLGANAVRIAVFRERLIARFR